MSQRSLIEINHDMSNEWGPEIEAMLREVARAGPAMRENYIEWMRLRGVTYLTTRHHSEPIRLPADVESKR
jgi:hypothetical protein